MQLSEMKKIAEARTKGEWSHDWGNHDIEIPWPNRSKSLLSRGEHGNYDANLEFAAMAANNWDKLMVVVEAAQSILYNLNWFNKHHLPIGIQEIKTELTIALENLEASNATK